jgi:alkyl hydroperoxide reductase subunit AhpC
VSGQPTHEEERMTIQLGQIAPDFDQDSSRGRVRFHEWLGNSWGVLFSHPKDYTPVCTTELAEAARLKPEWDKRNVKVIGLSVDPADSHKGWEADIEETQGQALNFPVLADADRKVSDLYGMVHPQADPTITVRSVFIIDPAKKVRLIMTYPPSTGRNFVEILRVIDSLQLTDRQKVATPANWQKGQPVIIVPSLSDEDARTRFPQGWKALKPYLRIVELPSEAAD